MSDFNTTKDFLKSACVAKSEQKTVVSDTKAGVVNLPGGTFLESVFSGNNIGATQAAEFYQNTSSVATAVDMVAEAIEQINPVLENEEQEFIDNHELISFLKKPNGFDLWKDFIGDMARNYLLAHDTVITATGNVKHKPISIWSSSMQNISVLHNQTDRYPQGFIVNSGPITGTFERNESERNNYRFFDGTLKELYRITGYSSKVSKVFPDSPLQAAANEARQIIKGKYHNLKLLDNGGRLSLVVAFNDEDVIDDEEHQQRVQQINEQHAGVDNSGKIMVISNADISKLQELGISNKDMDYGNLETMASNAIYLRYRIPLPLVTTKASTFNNVATGVGIFYDSGVLPIADILFAGLSNFLLPRFGLDPLKNRLTYNPESIDALKQRKIEEVKTRKEIGVETTNELRSLLPKREPIEGGDVLYQNSNLIQVGTDLVTDDNNNT